MEIIEKKIEELTPYENNPRKNDGAVEYVANSIRDFGFKVPIVIDKNNVIIAGHTRLKAAKKLGMKTVPCILADDLTDQQVKAFRLADNKVGEIAQWDFDLLVGEIADIEINMEKYAFFDKNAVDFDFVIDPDKEEDEEPEEKKEKEKKMVQCPHCGEWSEL